MEEMPSLEYISDGHETVAAPCPVDRMLHRAECEQKRPLTDFYAVPTLMNALKDVPKTQRIISNVLKDNVYAADVAVDALDRWEKARIAAGEMVGVLAAQSLGEPVTQMTLNSVDWNTDLIIRWNQYTPAPKNGSVGQLIDSLMETSTPSHPDPNEPRTTYLELPHGAAEALTVDADGNVMWKPLLAVTRHPPVNKDNSNTLVRVTTKSGRSVTCTKAKSFLIVQNQQVCEIAGSDLRVGMHVPITFELPSCDTSLLDLNVYLDKKQCIFTTCAHSAWKDIPPGKKSWFCTPAILLTTAVILVETR